MLKSFLFYFYRLFGPKTTQEILEDLIKEMNRKDYRDGPNFQGAKLEVESLESMFKQNHS